jgi:hypothetical protein
MKTSENSDSTNKSKENIAESNGKVDAFLNNGANTTVGRCLEGHTWTYAGSIHYNLEGLPCDCGMVLYHSEKCECCESIVVKPILNKQ